MSYAVLRIRPRDLVPFWPRDPEFGMVKKSGSGSGMNKSDHISESLETILGLKYLNSLMRIRDPGWKKFGSGINILDPQHWWYATKTTYYFVHDVSSILYTPLPRPLLCSILLFCILILTFFPFLSGIMWNCGLRMDSWPGPPWTTMAEASRYLMRPYERIGLAHVFACFINVVPL